jgi:hypothetical protein
LQQVNANLTYFDGVWMSTEENDVICEDYLMESDKNVTDYYDV